MRGHGVAGLWLNGEAVAIYQHPAYWPAFDYPHISHMAKVRRVALKQMLVERSGLKFVGG